MTTFEKLLLRSLCEIIDSLNRINECLPGTGHLVDHGKIRKLMDDVNQACGDDQPEVPVLVPPSPVNRVVRRRATTVTVGVWSKTFKTFADAVIGAWEHIEGLRPGFMETWAASPHGRGRVNPYVSKSPEGMREPSRCVAGTWYVSTHRSSDDLKRLLRLSCEANDVEFGVAVVISKDEDDEESEL